MNPLAENIKQAHSAAERAAAEAKQGIEAAVIARREAASMVEAAQRQFRARLAQWWTENLPEMEYSAAKRYLSLAKKPADHGLDKTQLTLCGILPPSAGRHPAASADRWPWIRQCALLAARLAVLDVGELPPVARLAALGALDRVMTAAFRLKSQLEDQGSIGRRHIDAPGQEIS